VADRGTGLTIRRGERWSVMGKNGAGKSTLLKMIAGQVTPDAGEAVFAIGRCAGWLAHALEEYAEAPLRFRLRARTVS